MDNKEKYFLMVNYNDCDSEQDFDEFETFEELEERLGTLSKESYYDVSNITVSVFKGVELEVSLKEIEEKTVVTKKVKKFIIGA